MQLGNKFQEKKCARCQREIYSGPAYQDDLWWHRTCLEEGKQALQRANEIAARFSFPPVYPGRSKDNLPPESAGVVC